VTAQVRLGDGEVVDVEREVKLGGPLHSKGVLILEGFIGGRYGRTRPLSLAASLVFEQSYGGVEGDSASLAECCALLSAIGRLPLRQDVAVTGSINQHGDVQPIGGVNQKIEGFFDVCDRLGLKGHEAVVIPAQNTGDLMLREDVVAAAAEGRFTVHTVKTVDDALEILTGLSAGTAGVDGTYPADSLNGRVERGLEELAERAHQLSDERIAAASRRAGVRTQAGKAAAIRRGRRGGAG
jgi:predicted ATP-dependent protease